jgi:putative tryptophan/tyrosine transport system substrate-binding protein
MKRREFFALLGCAAVACPLAAGAQQLSKIYRLGCLAATRIPNAIEALQTGLRDLGYIEGKNLKVDTDLADTSRKPWQSSLQSL